MADKVEESYVFAEDVVCLKENGNSTKLGLVIKNGSNMSDSEDSFDSEDEEEERVKSGELLVCWYPSGQEEVIPESKVELADRSLQPGDVVRRHVHNQYSNQKGYVTDIEITADILILGTQLVIKDVKCKKYLSPLQILSPWTRIAFGPWVGLIKNVYRRIVLWLKNGSRCYLEEEQLSMLYDIVEKRDEDSPFYNAEFFPSQAVIGPAKAFKEAKWLSKIKPILTDQNQVKAVVEESTIVKIDVEWQVCGSCPPGCAKDNCEKPPEETINEDQLDKVKVFQHYQQAAIQIGDKGYYIVKEEDVPTKEVNNSECVQETSGTKQANSVLPGKVNNIEPEDKKYTDGQRESSSINEKHSGFDRGVERLEEAVQAGCEDSLVDKTVTVDSKETMDTDHDLIKDNSEVAHCEGYQNDKAAKDNLDASRMDDSSKADAEHISESDDGDVESDGQEQSKLKTSRQDSLSKHSTRRRRRRLRHKRKTQFTVKIKTGDRVCVEVVKTRTVAHVMWQDGHMEKDINTLDLIPTYHNDEHQFFPGHFVADKRGTGEVNSQNNSDGYGVIKYGKHDDRTCTVKWFDKSGDSLGVEDDVSVYDIAEHPDFAFNPGDLVVGISGGAHDVEDMTSKGEHCVAGQVVCVDSEGQVVVAWVGGSGDQRAYKPQELYKVDSEDVVVKKLLQDLYKFDSEDEEETYSDGSHSEVNSDESDEWETASEESNGNEAGDQNNVHDEIPEQFLSIGLSPIEPCSPEIENVDIEALNNANNVLRGNAENTETSEAVGFSMLSEAPTNHVLKAANGATFQPSNQSKFLSVLRKEILLLQSSIPPGILIRGFENSMDLFSVLIQGPDDTPYEGGLFLFDIALPQDYPSSPPKVHFISYSKNGLNPNLYVDGTVCVSLLGTWNGKETEVWTSKSNILQVLLSIQGLILCKEPYYNEAGYDKHRGTAEGTDNSRLYNEMVILQLIDSLGNLIRSTHPVFDKEIKDHFKNNGHKIIRRFKSWISHADNLNKTNSSEEKSNSTVEDTDIVSEGESSSAEAERCKIPEFPLFPLSKGFLICLKRSSKELLKALENTKS